MTINSNSESDGRRIVVVGASLGGLRAAEALRGAGFRGELVVVGEEPHLPYNRPPLSKEALAGGVSVSALEFRRRASVDDVVWRLGTRAVGADLQSREVVLDDGSVMAFDALVVASGLRPRRLGIVAPPAGRHAIRTAADALGLRAELLPGARVVVIGAGFIGCEVAATATGLGCHVEVVAPEAVPMQRPLGVAVGEAMRRRHEAHGVRWHLGRTPTAVEPSATQASRPGAVLLDDGTRVAADVVVEAVGCVPNTDWLTGTDLELSDGVLTDDWMRARSADGGVHREVVAVGDVARFPNALFDDVPRRVEHWSTPADTARRAATALLAGLDGGDPEPSPFTPMPSFWSDQYDARLQAFGALALADTDTVLDGDLDEQFVVGYYRGGDLVGVLGIGHMPRLMQLRGDILQRVRSTA